MMFEFLWFLVKESSETLIFSYYCKRISKISFLALSKTIIFPACFLMRDKKGVDPDGRGGGRNRGVEGRKPWSVYTLWKINLDSIKGKGYFYMLPFLKLVILKGILMGFWLIIYAVIYSKIY